MYAWPATKKPSKDSETKTKVSEKPAVPKLKKKEQLESSLLDAIEEHGTEEKT